MALVTGNAAAWSLIADSGSSGDLSYDITSNVLSGTLDAVSFGHGLTYDASSDSFFHKTDDISFSGLNLSGSGADNSVHTLTYDLMSGNIAELETVLNFNELVINGSSGNDVLQGYAGDDVLTGGAGADVFVFDNLSGNDVITDLQTGDTIDICRAPAGALQISRGNDVITDLQTGDTIEILWEGVTEFADLIIDYAADAGNAVISAAGVSDTITVEGFSSGLDDTYFM